MTSAKPNATSAIAKMRWKLLSSVIVKQASYSRENPDHENNEKLGAARETAIRFPKYGLVEITDEEDDEEEDLQWCRVKSRDERFKFDFRVRPLFFTLFFLDRVISLTTIFQVCLLRPDFSARDLIGFNNTGNVCVWPAEECMTMYCLENRGDIFNARKKVIELGGGMTCLAALILAKTIPHLDSVLVTDGNEASVDNLRSILGKNEDLGDRVSAEILRWSKSLRPDLRAAFDVVLCADCLFFDEFRLPLRDCIAALLKPTGVAVVMAPKRGKTYADFVSKVKDKFAVVTEDARYSERIWGRRQELTNDKRFSEDIHYPVLLTLAQPRLTSQL